jgi:hypothetical protein
MLRSKIAGRHTDRISYLYTPEARDIYNTKNREAIRKLLARK